jgi:hypothetical protein
VVDDLSSGRRGNLTGVRAKVDFRLASATDLPPSGLGDPSLGADLRSAIRQRSIRIKPCEYRWNTECGCRRAPCQGKAVRLRRVFLRVSVAPRART